MALLLYNFTFAVPLTTFCVSLMYAKIACIAGLNHNALSIKLDNVFSKIGLKCDTSRTSVQSSLSL